LSSFVIDASATLPWCFKDEATFETKALLQRLRSGDKGIVPAHWPTEVMNGLVVAVRRQRIAFADVLEFAELLTSLPIEIEPASPPTAWEVLLTTAQDAGLTIYDAAYLQLARDRKLPLATFDADLQKAAKADAISLLL
jgi:predicted nucleic acid-binding protein